MGTTTFVNVFVNLLPSSITSCKSKYVYVQKVCKNTAASVLLAPKKAENIPTKQYLSTLLTKIIKLPSPCSQMHDNCFCQKTYNNCDGSAAITHYPDSSILVNYLV